VTGELAYGDANAAFAWDLQHAAGSGRSTAAKPSPCRRGARRVGR